MSAQLQPYRMQLQFFLKKKRSVNIDFSATNKQKQGHEPVPVVLDTDAFRTVRETPAVFPVKSPVTVGPFAKITGGWKAIEHNDTITASHTDYRNIHKVNITISLSLETLS